MVIAAALLKREKKARRFLRLFGGSCSNQLQTFYIFPPSLHLAEVLKYISKGQEEEEKHGVFST